MMSEVLVYAEMDLACPQGNPESCAIIHKPQGDARTFLQGFEVSLDGLFWMPKFKVNEPWLE